LPKRVQKGEKPKDLKPMSSIGGKVFELRQRDKAGWYRTIYFGLLDGKMYILHSFIKKSAKTPSNDLNVAASRLKEVRIRLKEKKKA
jgi:phage-related protein